MRKYIDADKAIKNYARYGISHFYDATDLEAILNECPAADVQEVKHGRWIDYKRMGVDGTFHWFRQCSECLYEREDGNEDKDTPYCPNCGSRMDLDGDTE